jgi:hypothetical protein
MAPAMTVIREKGIISIAFSAKLRVPARHVSMAGRLFE